MKEDVKDCEQAGIARGKNDRQKEHSPIDDLLSQYSDAEKAKAFQKLDWSLIPLFDPDPPI